MTASYEAPKTRSGLWFAATAVLGLRRRWIAIGEEAKALARAARETVDLALIIQIAIFGGLMLALLIFPN